MNKLTREIWNEWQAERKLIPMWFCSDFIKNMALKLYTYIDTLLDERDTLQADLELQKKRLCSHGDYKLWGTYGCRKCDDGRITLYVLEETCLGCKK